MSNVRILSFVMLCVTPIIACMDGSADKASAAKAEKSSAPVDWWASAQAIVINGDEFYGKPCSVTRVSRDAAGVKSGSVIFNVPSRMLTYCANYDPKRKYLEYDGEYIILHVDRQTFGAGSWTGERYRSSDFRSWEEYIGISWVKGEEYEAWRKVGSISSED